MHPWYKLKQSCPDLLFKPSILNCGIVDLMTRTLLLYRQSLWHVVALVVGTMTKSFLFLFTILNLFYLFSSYLPTYFNRFNHSGGPDNCILLGCLLLSCTGYLYLPCWTAVVFVLDKFLGSFRLPGVTVCCCRYVCLGLASLSPFGVLFLIWC